MTAPSQELTAAERALCEKAMTLCPQYHWLLPLLRAERPAAWWRAYARVRLALFFPGGVGAGSRE